MGVEMSRAAGVHADVGNRQTHVLWVKKGDPPILSVSLCPQAFFFGNIPLLSYRLHSFWRLFYAAAVRA